MPKSQRGILPFATKATVRLLAVGSAGRAAIHAL
jgi:hypothetical protein